MLALLLDDAIRAKLERIDEAESGPRETKRPVQLSRASAVNEVTTYIVFDINGQKGRMKAIERPAH
jgi:hypothetical protein